MSYTEYDDVVFKGSPVLLQTEMAPQCDQGRTISAEKSDIIKFRHTIASLKIKAQAERAARATKTKEEHERRPKTKEARAEKRAKMKDERAQDEGKGEERLRVGLPVEGM